MIPSSGINFTNYQPEYWVHYNQLFSSSQIPGFVPILEVINTRVGKIVEIVKEMLCNIITVFVHSEFKPQRSTLLYISSGLIKYQFKHLGWYQLNLSRITALVSKPETSVSIYNLVYGWYSSSRLRICFWVFMHLLSLLLNY